MGDVTGPQKWREILNYRVQFLACILSFLFPGFVLLGSNHDSKDSEEMYFLAM